MMNNAVLTKRAISKVITHLLAVKGASIWIQPNAVNKSNSR